eukprot:3375410-Amphidinium_carterae.1
MVGCMDKSGEGAELSTTKASQTSSLPLMRRSPVQQLGSRVCERNPIVVAPRSIANALELN